MSILWSFHAEGSDITLKSVFFFWFLECKLPLSLLAKSSDVGYSKIVHWRCKQRVTGRYAFVKTPFKVAHHMTAVAQEVGSRLSINHKVGGLIPDSAYGSVFGQHTEFPIAPSGCCLGVFVNALSIEISWFALDRKHCTWWAVRVKIHLILTAFMYLYWLPCVFWVRFVHRL